METKDTRVDQRQYDQPLATASTDEAPMPTPVRTVAVFTHRGERGRVDRHFAYTRYFNPEWEGCCLHRVSADTGTGAKLVAIANHKLGIGCGAKADA